MEQINGAWRYSPKPPQNYRPLISGCNVTPLLDEYIEDLSVWNLIWLSIPEVDRLLEVAELKLTPGPLMNGLVRVSELIGHARIARCKISVQMNDNLRWALTLRPQQFLATLSEMDLTQVALIDSDPDVLQVIESRLGSLIGTEDSIDLSSNVVYVNFNNQQWIQ